MTWINLPIFSRDDLKPIVEAYDELETYLEEIHFTSTGWRLMDQLHDALVKAGEKND